MASYNSPDVYIQDVQTGAQSINPNSGLTGIMLGATKTGPVGVPTLVNSFAEYTEIFAKGQETAFLADSLLAYAVYGFYQNGGGPLYIDRVAHSATKASVTDAEGISATAKYPGNTDVTIKFTKNVDWTSTNLLYDVEVGTSADSWKVTEVTVADLISKLAADADISEIIDTSTITIATGYTLTETTITLTGGTDGITTLVDNDFTTALTSDGIDLLADDVVLIAIPGQTSATVNTALIAFADKYFMHPLLDMPMASTVSATRTYRKSISGKGGCLNYPWLKVNDPLSEGLKTVPTAGHMMGMYVRMYNERGMQKVPAGTTAVVQGAVDLETRLTKSDVDVLNPVGVNCIMSRPNAGIVMWGARSLSTDTSMKYVSDIIINYCIRRDLYKGTQFAVFEPNEESLWKRLENTCTAYLESLRKQGVLRGLEPSDAYRVICDISNNTQATIDAGELHIDIAYAPNKPAEFIIIHLAHTMES